MRAAPTHRHSEAPGELAFPLMCTYQYVVHWLIMYFFFFKCERCADRSRPDPIMPSGEFKKQSQVRERFDSSQHLRTHFNKAGATQYRREHRIWFPHLQVSMGQGAGATTLTLASYSVAMQLRQSVLSYTAVVHRSTRCPSSTKFRPQHCHPHCSAFAKYGISVTPGAGARSKLFNKQTKK